jgi:hypothetical protein
MDYTTLKTEADQIANETTTGANTATRIGTWMQNALSWMSDQVRGKSDGAVAGSIIPWPSAVIPDGYHLCDGSSGWDMTTYADLYNFLGGLNSPWGVDSTTGTFSLPLISEGYTVTQVGSTFTLAKTGGASSVALTVDNLAPFQVRIGLNNGGAGAPEWTNPDKTTSTRKYSLASQTTSTYSSGYSDTLGKGTPVSIMPPNVALNFIIKITNSDNNAFTAAIDSNGHLILTFSDGSTQDSGSVMDTTALTAETQARANADTALQTAINGKENVGVAQQLITNLINNSPTALTTLKALADALGDDANFSTTITNLIGTKANSVDLTAEATARANADAALQQNLSNETSEREQSDDTIQLQIVNAVNTLQASINGKENTGVAQALINALINNAPATLNTLKALADAINDDPAFATTINTLIATKAASTDLTAEATARANADAVLQQNITSGLAGKVDRVALLSVSDEPNSTNLGDLWYDPSTSSIFTNILTTSQVGDRTFHLFTWSNPQAPVSGVIYTCNGINYIWDGNGKLAQIASYTDLITLNTAIENASTPPVLAVNKTNANGIVSSQIFSYPVDLKISAVTIMSNATNISVQIGSNTYDKDSLLNIALPANTELTIVDLAIKTGGNSGSATITFSKS